MRVLHAPSEIAGQPSILARALRAARVVVAKSDH